MLSIAELLATRAGTGRPAIIEGATGRGVGWDEVLDLSARWQQSGLVGPVGLAVADPVAMAAHFVAALDARVVVAPLDPAAPPGDLAARATQLQLRSLVTDRDGILPGLETWRAGRDELVPLGGEPSAVAALPSEPADVRAIMASSGTTGRPKIVPLTEPQLLATAAGVADHLGLRPDDRGYSPLPLFHINGLVVGVLSALVAGSSIAVERQFSRRSFWQVVESTGATWVNLVPAILSILSSRSSAEGRAGGVRLARSASAPLPLPVRERFERVTGIPIVETYGMTEAASQITANPVGAVRECSAGRPIGVELRVVDPAVRPVEEGVTGRVQIRGERVTAWYWAAEPSGWTARPALDADSWLDTGDVGWLDPEGFLYLVGRDGDVINRGGEKVQPREVEEVLLGDPRVTAAVVVGRPHPTVGEEPVAYVLAAEQVAADPERLASDLDRLCQVSLSRFKRPAQIVVARSLPAGPTGKVKRAEVRAMADAATVTTDHHDHRTRSA